MAFDIGALEKASLQPPQAQTTDLARYILTHANVDWSKAANLNTPQKKPGSPSVLSRVLDLMSRPSYAVDEMARRFIEHNASNTNPETGETTPLNPQKHSQDFFHEVGDILHGGASGLAGTQKTTWSKTLTELNPNASPVARYGGGLALDLFTDPTTYIGPGLVRNLFRGGKALVSGGKLAEKGIPESKGALSVIEGMPKVPAESRNAQALPPALSRASEQVRLPDFHAPGAPVNPKMSVPKVQIYTPGFGAPSKDIAEIANKATPLTKEEIDAISRGGARTTAQILTRISKEKGYTQADPRKIEKIISGASESDRPQIIQHIIQSVRNSPISHTGLDAKQEAKAISLDKLQKGAKLRLPMINPKTGVNIEKAGDIVDKIAQGDFTKLSAPAVHVDISPQTRFWAERTAKEFEQSVLKQPNKFSGKAALNNPAQQANLFLRYANKVAPKLIKGAKNPNAKKFMVKRYSDAYKMMKVAEDYYRAKGLHPTFWDGSRVALTEVMDELGGPAKMTQEHMTQLVTAFKNKNPEKIVNPEIRQAIENVRARDALQSAKWVRNSLDANTQQAKVAEQVLSHGKYNDFVKNLISKNKQIMQVATDASPAGINSTQHLLREILTRNGSLPQLATDAKKTYIQRYVTPGSKKIKWLPVQASQTRALEQVLGSKPAQLGRELDHDGQAENWFMSRFATWYGQKDLRPEVLNQVSGAMANAAARARIWNQVNKDYLPNEIDEAFKIAQGHILSPSSSKVSDLGMQFQRALENLFASTGITNEAQKAASVAMRSGMVMEDINEQLKLVRSDFRFTNAKEVKDFMGNIHKNYAEGSNWLKSWEAAQIKDPLDFVMRLESATEQLSHKYAYLDELAARYGSKVKSSIFSTPVANRRLAGVYFAKDLAPQIEKSLATWHQIYDPKSPLIKFLDKVTRAWKSGVTVYAPSHHIRNFIGDVYLSWLSGVNNPRAYTIAGRVLKSQKNRYKSLETINDLTDKNAVRHALTRPGDKVLTTKGGVDLTAEQIYIAAHSKGLLSHVNVIEDLIGDPLIKAEPFNGKVKDFVHSASELREHYVRLAHFSHYLMNSKEKDLPRLFSQASHEVRKWHPDGLDLTKFEREKMKRVFPFYSWTRKTIPLMVESAVQRPGKILAYPRAMYALQGSMGIQSPGPTDPFPQDQLFPNWIKSKGIGPILGGPGNYSIVNPSNPFNDLVSQYAGTGKPRDVLSGVGSSLNPLARVPAEVLTGQTVLGQPVDQDVNRYATEQIPIASYLSRIGNMGIAGSTNKAQKQGNFNSSALWNLLFALGIQPTAPYIKQAEFEKKQGLQ